MLQLPTEAIVRDLLTTTVGREVTVRYVAEPLLVGSTAAAVAAYVDDDGLLRAVTACDLALAAAVGASLALLPMRRVAEAVRQGRLPPDLAEHLREVCNVAANFFTGQGNPHVRLRDVQAPPAVERRLLGYVERGTPRLDLRVGVSGYGEGSLSIVAV